MAALAARMGERRGDKHLLNHALTGANIAMDDPLLSRQKRERIEELMQRLIQGASSPS